MVYLRRPRKLITSVCLLCDQPCTDETVEHLFLSCPFAQCIREFIFAFLTELLDVIIAIEKAYVRRWLHIWIGSDSLLIIFHLKKIGFHILGLSFIVGIIVLSLYLPFKFGFLMCSFKKFYRTSEALCHNLMVRGGSSFNCFYFGECGSQLF
ncbi:hypothetical protein WN944_015457 [Citrus x changshan-huyou]|uniref:Uncharacterized protein n=1 Tax=Citrus x changshan-huyou TaxID=2935761 RepID=A0AAP0MCJ3_9ROSI